MARPIMHCDFETRSEVDLIKQGVDLYTASPTTQPLMLSWAVEDEPVSLWFPRTKEYPAHVLRRLEEFTPLERLAFGKAPKRLVESIRDPQMLLGAHNAQFEHLIFTRVLGVNIDLRRWRDTMIMAFHCGMPGKLGELCQVVGMDEENQKLKEGHRLIKLFCVPRKPTAGKPWLFNDWNTHPDDWALFCKYGVGDTKAERDLYRKLLPFDLLDEEWEAWALDQRINHRGIPVDRRFVNNAMAMYKKAQTRSKTYLKRLTGLPNAMSSAQMLPWARERGYPYNDMRKATVARGIIDGDLTPECEEALQIRAETNKASLKKYDAIAARTADDDRLRFVFQFLGASRTGRWAGRAVQPQNFSRPAKAHEKKLDALTELIRANDFDELEFEHGEVMGILSSCLRSSFRAPDGMKLVVADLSSIEDRKVAWLARCETILDEHRGGLDPYKSFGTHLYMKKYEQITKEERTNSKPGRLGCCYRLSAGELKTNKNGDVVKTGLWGYAESMGVSLTQEECAKAVSAYRNAYPEVVQFWYDLEEAAKRAIKTRMPQRVGHVTFDVKAPFLRLRLPSGRHLHYLRPKLEQKEFTSPKNGEPYTKEVLSYEGVDQVTKKWGRIYTHGGKLCENVTQAAARDVLLHGMFEAERAGFEIVLHVHDEIVALMPEDHPLTHKDLEACMSKNPPWCLDLPLGAAGYTGSFYRKD